MLIGGHIDSVPNGGWLDGCLNVARRRRGAAPDRRGGRAAGHGAARRLGRRGGRALRALALRLVGGGGLDARPGRAARSSSTATGSRCPRRSRAHGVELDARDRRARAARGRGGLPRAAHRAGPGARVDGPAARRRARHVRRRALAHHVARPGRARRLDADGLSAATRSRARRSSRSHIREIAAEAGGGAVCTSGGVVCKPGSSPRSSRPPSSCSTSATSTRRRSRGCSQLAHEASERFAAEENIEVEWERIWQIEPILFDDDADRARRRVDPRGRGHVPPAPVGPAARRGRGLARRACRR